MRGKGERSRLKGLPLTGTASAIAPDDDLRSPSIRGRVQGPGVLAS